MLCGKSNGIMTQLHAILIQVFIYQFFCAEKMEDHHFENLLIESTSEFKVSLTFLLVNENLKCGYLFS